MDDFLWAIENAGAEGLVDDGVVGAGVQAVVGGAMETVVVGGKGKGGVGVGGLVKRMCRSRLGFG